MNQRETLRKARNYLLGAAISILPIASTQAQDIIEWQPKNITEEVIDSTSLSPLQGVSINYELINKINNPPTEALNDYNFLTGFDGKDIQDVLVQRKKPDGIQEKYSESYGLGIRGDGLVSVKMNRPIVNFSVYDMTGKQIQQQKVHDQDGTEQFTTNISKLGTGMYIGVTTSKNGERIATKFVTNNSLRWNISPGFNPITNNVSNKKSTTLEEEITTAYKRTLDKEGFHPKIDTVFLRYDNGSDTSFVTSLAKTPVLFNYTISGDESTPEGAIGEAWDEGELLARDTIKNGQYALNWENELENMELDSLRFMKPDWENIVIEKYNATPGTNNIEVNLLKPYTIPITLDGGNKTPQSFTGYATVNGDTVDIKEFTGTNGTLQFKSTKESVEAKIEASNIPYFNDATGKSIVLNGNNPVTLSASPIVFLYSITGNVSDEEGTPQTANISANGKNDDTDSNGDYTINDIIRNTNTNNVPQNYPENAIATGNFETITKNYTVDGNNKIINFEVPLPGTAYTANGFAMNISGENLVANQEAAKIKTQYGTYTVTTDENGEFSTEYRAEPGEQVKIYSNATGYDDLMLALSKHDEEIPQQRRMTSSWGSDTATYQADKLDDAYFRIALTDDWIKNDENFAHATREEIRSTHGTDSAITRWVYTAGMPQNVIDAAVSQYQKMPGIMTLPLTGQLFPITDNIIESSTGPTTPKGTSLTRFISGGGYWNHPYYTDGTGDYMEGNEATISGLNLGKILEEQINWVLPDATTGRIGPFMNGIDDEYLSTNTLGKAVVYTRTDYEPSE